MYYAVIDSASLKNPTILNKYKHLRVTVRFEPQSTTSKYHYNFLLQFPNSIVNKAIADIQNEMLHSWYSFFWNDNILNVVFDKKRFFVSLPNGWLSNEIEEARKYGRLQGIPEEYLDFKVYFKPHKDTVQEFSK